MLPRTLWILPFLFILTASPVTGEDSIYKKDVRFALEALEEKCGSFFKLKEIDWKKVSKQFLKEAGAVKTDQEHLVLLVRLLARIEDGRAYMIGESPTAGMSSQKTTIDLPSGLFSLYVSVRPNKRQFNKGRGIEGIGVIPHEIKEFDPKDLAKKKDTLILYAEKLLEKFPEKEVPYDPAKFGWKK